MLIVNSMGNFTKYVRRSRGLTRKEFAEITGLSENIIGNLENGRTSMSRERQKLFFDVLQIDKEDLKQYFVYMNVTNAKEQAEAISKEIPINK